MKKSGKWNRWYTHPWVIALCAIICLPVLFSLVPLGGHSNRFSFHAGSIRSSDNLSTAAMTSGNEDAFYTARRILLLNRSDHRLMHGVAEKLKARLVQRYGVDQVDLAEPGNGIPSGALLYDLYVVMDLESFRVSGLLVTGRTLRAKVHLSCGRQVFESSQGYTDSYSLPYAGSQMSCTLEHESVAHGYETAGVRYKQEIDEIEKQLGGALEKHLADWAAKYNDPAGMPAELFPAYRPVPEDLPHSVLETAELVLSGNGPMLRNRSIWSLETDTPHAVMNEWHRQLADQQWKLDPEALMESEQPYYLRAHRGAEMVEAFEVRTGYATRAHDEPVQLVFRYSDRMTPEEVVPVFDAMTLDADLPLAIGLGFYQTLNPDQKERLVESWMQRETLPFSAELKITRYLHDTGRQDEARHRLKRLRLAALFDAGDRIDEVRKIGREIMKDEEWEPDPPAPDALIAAGVMDGSTNAMTEVALNEAAVFLLRKTDDPDQLTLIDIMVKPSAIPEGIYTLEVRRRVGPEFKPLDRSFSTPHTQDHPWHHEILTSVDGESRVAEAVESENGRFKVSFNRR